MAKTSIPGRRNSKSKSPEMEKYLACVWNKRGPEFGGVGRNQKILSDRLSDRSTALNRPAINSCYLLSTAVLSTPHSYRKKRNEEKRIKIP